MTVQIEICKLMSHSKKEGNIDPLFGRFSEISFAIILEKIDSIKVTEYHQIEVSIVIQIDEGSAIGPTVSFHTNPSPRLIRR